MITWKKGSRKNSTPTKPLYSSLTPKETEVVEFKLFVFKKTVESMKDEIKQELDAFKNVINDIKGNNLNQLRFFHNLTSYDGEEDKENKNVESQSLIGKIEARLEKNRFKSLKFNHSSLQGTYFQRFKSILGNYVTSKMDVRKFDDDYPLIT